MCRVLEAQAQVRHHQNDYLGVVDMFRRNLKGLGIAKFPKKPSIFNALYYLMKAKSALKSYDIVKLLELPVCKDPKVIADRGVPIVLHFVSVHVSNEPQLLHHRRFSGRPFYGVSNME